MVLVYARYWQPGDPQGHGVSLGELHVGLWPPARLRPLECPSDQHIYIYIYIYIYALYIYTHMYINIDYIHTYTFLY